MAATLTQDPKTTPFTTDTQWVTFHLDNQLYAFSIETVREMVLLPELSAVPHTPPHILGVVSLRDSTIAVLDLRVRLGMASLEQQRHDLIENLKKRKQDHVDWLTALRTAVREGTPFTKATDPHKCAFGVWYDGYKTDDLALAALLKKFDEPHNAIHGVAGHVLALEKEQKHDEAEKLMSRVEGRELKQMVDLFDMVITLLAKDEKRITVIVELPDGVCGMTVDSVESVITLRPEEINPSPEMSTASKGKDVILGVAKPKGWEKMILLLDPSRLVGKEEIRISQPRQ